MIAFAQKATRLLNLDAIDLGAGTEKFLCLKPNILRKTVDSRISNMLLWVVIYFFPFLKQPK